MVVEGNNTRVVYLPGGRWFDFWSGERREGPIWIDVTMDLDRIPVFVRGGASIPLRLGSNRQLFEPTGNGTSLTDGLVIVIAGSAAIEAAWLDENQQLVSAPVRVDESGEVGREVDSVTMVPIGSLGSFPIQASRETD